MQFADKKQLEAIRIKAKERKEQILNSKSDYPKDAKRYFYIDSIDGDDIADGLSPETAWKNVEKIRNAGYLTDSEIYISDVTPTIEGPTVKI